MRLGDLSVIWIASPFGYNCPFMLLVWMIIGRMVMMMMTLTRDLNDGMELIEQSVGGGNADNSIMKTLTNRMKLA